MTLKTLIAAMFIALALAPAASASGGAVLVPAVDAQTAKWRAYDEAARTAFAPAKAANARPAAERPVPPGTRVVLGFVVLAAAATIVAIRRRDAMFRPAAGGWDI